MSCLISYRHSLTSQDRRGCSAATPIACRIDGFSTLSLRTVLADPDLQARLAAGDDELDNALGLAGINLEARVGAIIKHSSQHLLGGRRFAVVSSYNISCHSVWGRLSNADDYVGLVLYAKDGRTEWSLGGVKCKAGYIYYRKTRDIQHIDSDYGQVHGKLYKSLFGCDPDDVIASGFSIRKGSWSFKSRTFNSWQAGNGVDMD